MNKSLHCSGLSFLACKMGMLRPSGRYCSCHLPPGPWGAMRRSPHLSGFGCQVKGCSPPVLLSPELGPGSPEAHRVLLVHIDLGRQDGHGGTAAGALAGTGPETRLAGVGAVLLQGAPGVARRRSGRRGAPPPRRLPWPSPHPRGLTASPGHTSRSRHRPHPRSPRRWCAQHTQRLSPWPSRGRGRGPDQRGCRPLPGESARRGL